jgi:hypothetical protein
MASNEEMSYWSILLKHFDLLKNEPKRTQELYMHVFSHVSSPAQKFHEFISDPCQKNTFGQEIAIHNLRVQKALFDAGINFNTWFSYGGWTSQKLNEYDRSRINELWCELEETLSGFKDFFVGTELYRSICKDIANIQKNKHSIRKGSHVWDSASSLPTYNQSLEYLEKKGRLPKVNAEHKPLLYRIDQILGMFSETLAVKHYQVRLWKRSPTRDLLQGNFSDCCIAIGDPNVYPHPGLRLPDVPYKKYPAGILEFLIDKGIQVAEVMDRDYGTVGQCWLFLSPTSDGRADLVADSFDVSRNLVTSDRQKAAIRLCMFRFLHKYAEAIGARRPLLGMRGQFMPNGKLRWIQHDICVNDLSDAFLEDRPIEKIGSYFQGQPYFLESRLGDRAFKIPRP